MAPEQPQPEPCPEFWGGGKRISDNPQGHPSPGDTPTHPRSPGHTGTICVFDDIGFVPLRLLLRGESATIWGSQGTRGGTGDTGAESPGGSLTALGWGNSKRTKVSRSPGATPGGTQGSRCAAAPAPGPVPSSPFPVPPVSHLQALGGRSLSLFPAPGRCCSALGTSYRGGGRNLSDLPQIKTPNQAVPPPLQMCFSRCAPHLSLPRAPQVSPPSLDDTEGSLLIAGLWGWPPSVVLPPQRLHVPPTFLGQRLTPGGTHLDR